MEVEKEGQGTDLKARRPAGEAEPLSAAELPPPKTHDVVDSPKTNEDAHPPPATKTYADAATSLRPEHNAVQASSAQRTSEVVIPITDPSTAGGEHDGGEAHFEEWQDLQCEFSDPPSSEQLPYPHQDKHPLRDHQQRDHHVLVNFHVLCSPKDFNSVTIILEEKDRKPMVKQMTLSAGAHWIATIQPLHSNLPRIKYKFVYSKEPAWYLKPFFSARDVTSRSYELQPGHLFHKGNRPTSPSYSDFLQYAFYLPRGERIECLLALHRALKEQFFTDRHHLEFLEQFSAAGLHDYSDSERVLFLVLLIAHMCPELLRSRQLVASLLLALSCTSVSNLQLASHARDIVARAFRELFRVAVDSQQPGQANVFMWAPVLADKLPLLVEQIDPSKVRAAEPAVFDKVMPVVGQALSVPGVVDNCHRLGEVLIFAAPDLARLCSLWDIVSVLRGHGPKGNQLADLFKTRMGKLATLPLLHEVAQVYGGLNNDAKEELGKIFVNSLLNCLSSQPHSDDLVRQTIAFSRQLSSSSCRQLSRSLMQSSSLRHRDLVPQLLPAVIAPSLDHAELVGVCQTWLDLCKKSVPKDRVLPAIFKHASDLLPHFHPQHEATTGILRWVESSLSALPKAQLLQGHDHAAGPAASLTNIYCSLVRSSIGSSLEYSSAIEYVRKISGSASALHISNPVMEQLILYVLEAVPKPSNVLGITRSGFWHTILLATGSVEKVTQHNQTAAVRRILTQWNTEFLQRDLTLDSLRAIGDGHSDPELVKHLQTLIVKKGCYATKDDIQAARERVADFSQRLKLLGQLIEQCRRFGAVDVERYQQKLNECNSSFGTLTLRQLTTDNILAPFSTGAHEAARILERWEGSVTFRNVLQATLTDEPDPQLTVEQVSSGLYPAAEANYAHECKKLQGQLADVPVRDAHSFWAHVTRDQIKTEVKIMREQLGISLSPVMLAALAHLTQLEDMQRRVGRLIEVWKLFSPGQSDPLEAEIERACQLEKDSQDNSLFDVQQASATLCSVLSPVAQHLWDLISELASSKELVGFVRDRMDEDFRNLIDAVEEHSDRFIREETVSGLIDVRRLLGHVLALQAGPIHDFIAKLCLHLRDTSAVVDQLTVRLRDCNANVHGLKRLFSSVSNRGELTKQIVLEVLEQGKMQFIIEPPAQECQIDVAIGERVLSNTDLQDLRSRALLIVNSERRAPPVNHDGDDSDGSVPDRESQPAQELRHQLRAFIELVELAQDIAAFVSDLCLQGHFSFAQFRSSEKADHANLTALKQRLSEDLNEWKDLLDQARRSCYYMCFFFSHQLRVLDECFSNPNPGQDSLQEFFHLLRFIDPSIPCTKKLCCGRYTAGETPQERLHQLTEELRLLFDDRAPESKALLKEVKLADEMQLGRLFIATTQKARVLHVVASLYLSSNAYLQPSHLLFCTAETQWEELHLLLMRCFFASSSKFGEGLFCIANVEALDFSLQSQLVEAMHALSREAAPHAHRHRLALVCCKESSKRHHIVEEFADHVQATTGVTDDTLKQLLRANCPLVHTVTSDLPGAGKTETAKTVAFDKKLGTLTVSVAGPITRAQLLEKLKASGLRDSEALHIDIGAGIDGEMLNTFLFELLLTEMVTAGTSFYYLRPQLVLLEVANTASNDLVDGLPICFLFPHQHLRCTVDRVIVSQEGTSPVQVVCHYLHALSAGTLNERDLIFDGPQANSAPLPADQCRQLLQRHFFAKKGDLSFTIMNVFLNILSLQLRKFSRSYYFTVANLKSMIGPNDVRQLAVKSLMEACLEFTTRSVTTCREEQTKSFSTATASSSLQMAERLGGMTRWDESNHLVVLFNRQHSHTISVLFRTPGLVPADVTRLLKSQAALGHPAAYQGEALLAKLERIVRGERAASTTYPPYALTSDNLLKMVLIYQRIQGRIPVVLMGETGCGKTSLVSFLARAVGIPFRCLNVHAGTTAAAVEDFVAEAEEEVRGKGEVMWLFFDEINTSEHIGLINDIVCHRLLQSRPIHPGISLLAACNPYRLRGKQVHTAGLAGKVQSDGQSRLVYRVYPLPETMIDFVWDFGSLDAQAEKFYIGSMVDKLLSGKNKWPHHDLLVSLLSLSQSFVRERETDWSVSLRDVRRCIGLVEWFSENQVSPPEKSGSHWRKWAHSLAGARTAYVKPEVKAVILALAHCYHSRFADHDVRKEYRSQVTQELQKHHLQLDEESFAAVLAAEQRAYLAMMELPSGTALNGALLENVFVVLVCIINRIPVFLVGKPGCSKSLSLQLINANLRGPDSKSDFFRRMPSVYMVSYQGSESSTSEGISAVFQKAQKYREHNTDSNVIPVVLLDEVGLAEASKYNPLKVLHSLLEPGYPKERPDIAVVGISNWSLDAAKMNRAIHLSRPEPDVNDLHETGRSIQQLPEYATTSAMLIEALANAYHEYYRTQSRANFHGLRDYYSLVKCLTRDGSRQLGVSELVNALARNFGGLPAQMNRIQEIFVTRVNYLAGLQDVSPLPVIELIEANLRDVEARHLMLITEGESAINILGGLLRSREPIVIYGSHYPDDQTEHYSYRILSRIILYMETGKCLILKDLEHIYGSLYDMLNQNYTVVGSKRNCRIALGAFSNPMCHVHEDFRCIVLVDQAKLDQSDPPFLNRFEKQLLTYDSIMSHRQKVIAQQLGEWARLFSTILREGQKLNFDEADAFAGFGEDTLASLILKHTHIELESLDADDTDNNDDATILDRCQRDLINVCPVDAILRCQVSQLAREAPEQVELARDIYFRQQAHSDFGSFFKHTLSAHANSSGRTPELKVLVNTFSNIHVDLGLAMIHVVLKLGTFSSERDLNTHIREFWRPSSTATLLVIQCDFEMDAEYLQLAKFAVDQHAAEYLKGEHELEKHVCILIHADRTAALNRRLPFNFLSGWQMATIDLLEKQERPLTSFFDCTIQQLLQSNDGEHYSFRRIFLDSLTWCFCTIRYPAAQESLAYVRGLMGKIAQSPELQGFIEEWVIGWIADVPQQNKDWCLHVACDRQRLSLAHTLKEAIHQYVIDMVRRPTAMLLCCLERQSALWTFFECAQTPQLRDLWWEFFVDPDVTDIRAMIPPAAPEAYPIDPERRMLKFPFSAHLFGRMETYRQLFLDDVTQRLMDDDQVTLSDIRSRYRDLASCAVPLKAAQLLVEHVQRYRDDFVLLANVCHELGPTHQMAAARWLLTSFGLGADGLTSPIDCHIVWWEHSSKISAMSRVLAALTSVASLDDLLATPGDKADQLLVATACINFLPRKSVVEHFGGVQEWRRAASAVLSHASKGREPPQLMHVLRVFSDLSALVSFDPSFDVQLFELAESAHEEQEHLLASPEVFSKVMGMVTSLARSNTPAAHDVALHFQRLFLARCLDCAFDTPLMPAILESLPIAGAPAGGASFMAPILVRLLASAEDHLERASLFELLCTDSSTSPDGNIWLDAITAWIDKHGPYSPVATFCCDILQQHFPPDFASLISEEDVMQEEDEDDEKQDLIAVIMEYLEGALQTLCDAKPNAFRLVLAVAFMRGLLAFVAEHLGGELGEDHPVVVRLRGHFVAPHNRTFAMQVYLLKHLRLSRSLQEVRNFCAEQRRLLPTLADMPWEVKVIDSPLGFNPFASFPNYRQAEELLLRLCLQREESQLLAFLTEQSPKNDPRAFVSLLGAVAHHIYLLNAQAELPSSYKLARDWLLEHLPKWLPAKGWRIGEALLRNEGMAVHLDSACSGQDLHLRAVIAHVLLGAYAHPSSSPLSQCATDLAAAARSFLPSLPSDEVSVVLRGMGEAVTRYACSCGYVYIVANCGATMQLSTCPACKGAIGGTSHRALPQQTRLDQLPQSGGDIPVHSQKGYVVESDDAIRSLHHSARSLPPLAYRAVHLLVHTALLAGLDTGLTFGGSSALPGVPSAQALLILVEQDWVILRQLLNCSDEELGVGLHILLEKLSEGAYAVVLTTEQQRQEWEQRVTVAVREIFGNVRTSAVAYVAHQATLCNSGGGLNLLESEIEERVELINDDYQRKFLPNLFRVTLSNTYESLKAAVHTSNSPPRFLQLLFHMEERLEKLAHLLPLVVWTSFVSSKLRYKVTRKRARSTTIAQFLEAAGGGETLAAHYRDFEHAWNAVRSSVTRFGCKELTMPQMSDSLSISYCCVEPKDEGAYVCATFEFLASLQNEFLDLVLQLAAEGHRALKHLEAQNGVGGIRSVNVQDVDIGHVVRYQWPDRVLLFSEHDLRYGHGREILYDMTKIEAELAQLFVYGKAHISTHTLGQFSFHSELPHTVGDTLREVRKLIQQEPIPDHHRQQIGAAVQQEISSALSLLGVLLSLLKRTSGLPDRTLENYCREWGLDAGLVELLRRHTPLSQLRLAHVVSLYETIEERAADKLTHSLDAKFSTPLDDHLRGLLRELTNRLPPASVVQALQRCIVRYIACEDGAADPNVPLNLYLAEADGAPSSLWPELPSTPSAVNLEELLPDDLLAAHIVTTLNFAMALLAERTPAPKRTTTVATQRKPVARGKRRFGGDQS